MSVRVRMFAALRDAAGVSEDQVDAGPLPALLATLCDRHGELFAQRLAVSTVLIDGTQTPRDAGVAVPDGAEIALLPPVSGGAGA
jgi:molybdopterin converting factor small subunit